MLIENVLKTIERVLDVEFDMSPDTDETVSRTSYYGEGTLFGTGIGISVTFDGDTVTQFIIESIPGENDFGIGYASVIKDEHDVFSITEDMSLALEGIVKMRKLLSILKDTDLEFIRANEGMLTTIGKTRMTEAHEMYSKITNIELHFEYLPVCISSMPGLLTEYGFDVCSIKDYSVVSGGLNINDAIDYVRTKYSK